MKIGHFYSNMCTKSIGQRYRQRVVITLCRGSNWKIVWYELWVIIRSNLFPSPPYYLLWAIDCKRCWKNMPYFFSIKDFSRYL